MATTAGCLWVSFFQHRILGRITYVDQRFLAWVGRGGWGKISTSYETYEDALDWLQHELAEVIEAPERLGMETEPIGVGT
jgi:hypothetical protein